MRPIEFNQQYQQLENLLFGFAMKLTRNREEAKDLMQETISKAYAKRADFMLGTNFKAWMTTIMRNAYINDYRKKKTRKRVEMPMDAAKRMVNSSVSPQTAEGKMRMKELIAMIESINEEYRTAFLMFYQGYKYNEIAQHFDVPIGTVKSRIFTAREKLKKMIQAQNRA